MKVDLGKVILVLTTVFVAVTNLFADCRASSPEILISMTKASFEKGDLETFNCLYEPEEGRVALREAVAEKYERQFDAGKIISTDGNKAVVLLNGLFRFGNSGNETYYAGKFSAIYRVAKIKDSWRIVERFPINANSLKSHSRLEFAGLDDGGFDYFGFGKGDSQRIDQSRRDYSRQIGTANMRQRIFGLCCKEVVSGKV